MTAVFIEDVDALQSYSATAFTVTFVRNDNLVLEASATIRQALAKVDHLGGSTNVAYFCRLLVSFL